ncbi:GNAT family N-acetyltransferase [Defluviimonas sp. SAOS-178_SWC]|uniref:GNAT family N-acetyltransferase n=1 Tax=Defluviimonas sp. SAOS-178_SWC TaxID=3121287 RepID=UPI003221F70B
MQAQIFPGLSLSALPPDTPPVRTEWRDQLRAHLLRLGPQTRLNRFLGASSDATVAGYAARAAPAVLIEARVGGQLCGMAELHVRPGPRPVGEIALSVEDVWQRQGIGAALFDRAVLEARRRGVGDIWIFYLRSNLAIRKISERAGFTRIEDADPAMASAHLGRPAAGEAEAAWNGAPPDSRD